MKKNTETIAVVPGSFDPITYGHIELVKAALKAYDRVYLAVMINPAKEYLFSIEERTAIAEAALADLDRVTVISSEGMLWRLCEELGATGIVKGYRNEQDLAYEQKMAEFNLAHNPNAPTELVLSPKELAAVSSTAVRERIQRGESLENYLPQRAEALIRQIISERGSF